VATKVRPGCLVRSALVTFALVFIPTAVWFAFAKEHRYVGRAIVLLIASVVFLWLGLSRREDSWITMIDELDPGDRK
jgi:hypothetical protein